MIHPSATIAKNSIIEHGARIGAKVRIGPFCLIQKDVDIGEGTEIASHTVINGHTRIGKHNLIERFCSIGEINQDLKYAGEPTRLVMGDCNHIGQYATLHRGTLQGTGITQIGDNNVFHDKVHIGHDCVVGNSVRFGIHSILAGHVEVDDNVELGAQSAVHQFCILGLGAKILAQSCVVQDIPPFVCVQGNRCKPVGIHEHALILRVEEDILRKIIHSLYQRLYHCAEALEVVREEIARLQQEYPLLGCYEHFFARSVRGIIR